MTELIQITALVALAVIWFIAIVAAIGAEVVSFFVRWRN